MTSSPVSGVHPDTSAANRAVLACPACGSVDHKETGAEAAGFRTSVAGRTFEQDPYFVRECSCCGLLYRTRALAPGKLDEYYSLVDFRKWETPGHYPTERCALSILRTLPRGSRILDFGCSSGRLLAGLVPDWDCHGFEINPAAAQEAAKKGLKILGSHELDGRKSATFEAVVLVDVFEHLSEPLALLQKLFRLVAEGGVLVVVTGNGDAEACRRDPAQFWYFRTVEHLCMLTRRHGNFLADRLGARLETWSTVCHYDLPNREKILQRLRHFAYWQFHRKTLLSKTLLPILPGFRRARRWSVAPAFTCSQDHVVMVLRKSTL
jgi:SAM-dependent methyltransferase